MQTRNFMVDFAKVPTTKPGNIVSFLFGVAAAAFIFLPLACVFWYFILQAALTEADFRAARAAIIAISESDKRCLQWAERSENEWVCVKR